MPKSAKSVKFFEVIVLPSLKRRAGSKQGEDETTGVHCAKRGYILRRLRSHGDIKQGSAQDGITLGVFGEGGRKVKPAGQPANQPTNQRLRLLSSWFLLFLLAEENS